MKPSAGTSAIDEFAVPADVLLANLETSSSGLTSGKAKEQSVLLGANQLQARQRARGLTLLLRQLTNPIVLILIGAAALSAFLRDGADAAIIIAIVVASGLLGFWQEHTAANAVAKLTAVVATKVRVLRDGAEVLLPLEEIVPGDVVIFCAGALVPADCRLLETRDLFVNEAALTGETYPVEKTPGMISTTTALAHRTNTVFMGTHVVSGTARAVVVRTGRATEFGKVYERLKLRPPETEFEHGIRRFGYLLAEITFLLVLAIFAFNVYFHEPVLDSFLFALALAVGLTPQLLPAIISINLAHGARRMAEQKVIVKRLAAIENFGSMNVLCSDKTGTLTEGEVRVHSALDPQGEASAKVMLYAYLNAANETGFVNPIDEAIRRAKVTGAAEWQKLDEIPYDFLRKRLSVLLENDGRHLLIAKGALRQMLAISSRAELSDGSIVPLESVRREVERQWQTCSSDGHRVLAVAYRDCGEQTRIAHSDEAEMIFLGLIVLFDPPKAGIAATVRELRDLGIALKIITGDNALIAAHLAHGVGFDQPRVLTGPEMREK